MGQSDYDDQNRVKASFDAAYVAETPHRYLRHMTSVEYRMAELMNPFVSAVVDASMTAEEPVRVLDVGCSYGVSGALLKTDCTYPELATFFRNEASTEYASCVAECERWLHAHGVREDLEVVGFDSSKEAIRFASASDMIDEGIALNLEEASSELSEGQAALIRRCDVVMSTGVIGYVTDKTVRPILDEFGKEAQGALGPVAVLSVLELFDPTSIGEAFVEHGYRFGQLPVRMPQRQFVDDEERQGVMDTLRERGVHVGVQDSEEQMFAGLCIAAKPARFDALRTCVSSVVEEYASPDQSFS